MEEAITTSLPAAREPAAAPRETSAGRPFRLFGNDGFSFFDLLDIVNPLQHIPLVATVYRSLTGDQIDPGSKIFGATLFGGPVGTAAATIDVMVEHGTGRDIGAHVAALFEGDKEAPNEIAGRAPAWIDPDKVPVAAAWVDPDKVPAAVAWVDPDRAPRPSPPVPRAAFSFLAPGAPSRAVPDLGLLGGPGLAEAVAAPSRRAEPASAPTATMRATAAEVALLQAEEAGVTADVEPGNGWVYQAMMQALDKYESAAKLRMDGPAGGSGETSIVR